VPSRFDSDPGPRRIGVFFARRILSAREAAVVQPNTDLPCAEKNRTVGPARPGTATERIRSTAAAPCKLKAFCIMPDCRPKKTSNPQSPPINWSRIRIPLRSLSTLHNSTFCFFFFFLFVFFFLFLLLGLMGFVAPFQLAEKYSRGSQPGRRSRPTRIKPVWRSFFFSFF